MYEAGLYQYTYIINRSGCFEDNYDSCLMKTRRLARCPEVRERPNCWGTLVSAVYSNGLSSSGRLLVFYEELGRAGAL